MAIIGNFEVTITSAGEVLREYDVAEEDQVDPEGDNNAQSVGYGGKVSTAKSENCFKYVEATPDANFETGYKMSGKQAFGCVASRRIYIAFAGHHFRATDEDPKMTMAELKAKYGSKGIIRVDVWRKQKRPSVANDRATPIVSSDIPESALKGRAVEIGVRNAEQIPYVNSTHSDPIDREPLATFVFFYRSKNALQTLGIIPRTPEPVPLEEREEETLTPAEMLELIRQQKAEGKAEKVKIKQEKAEANLRQLAGIKREADGQDDEDVTIVVQLAKKARREVAVVELLD